MDAIQSRAVAPHNPKPTPPCPWYNQEEKNELANKIATYIENSATAKPPPPNVAQMRSDSQRIEEQTRPERITEAPAPGQTENADDRTIPKCPKSKGAFTYPEEVIIHTCSNDPDDLRAEYEALLHLREFTKRNFVKRTLEHEDKRTKSSGGL